MYETMLAYCSLCGVLLEEADDDRGHGQTPTKSLSWTKEIRAGASSREDTVPNTDML